jgi:hypothetical protein
VSAERALKTILGNEDQPTDEEMESVEDMRNRLLGMTREDATDYGSTADYAASLILNFILEDAARRIAIPTEMEYDWDGDPDHGANGCKPEYVIHKGLYAVMKEAGPPYDEIGELGLTGFMWGWAVNAARRCVNMPPKPNPAIVEINL